jgi:hypothetical protein
VIVAALVLLVVGLALLAHESYVDRCDREAADYYRRLREEM